MEFIMKKNNLSFVLVLIGCLVTGSSVTAMKKRKNTNLKRSMKIKNERLKSLGSKFKKLEVLAKKIKQIQSEKLSDKQKNVLKFKMS